MKYFLFCLLIFTHCVKAQVTQSAPIIYRLKYYYPEEPEKIVSTRGYARNVNSDGSFCLTDYDIKTGNAVFSSCFDINGVPTQSGSDKIYLDSLHLTFRGKDTTILMNAVTLKDPTTLWFWKYMPKINEKVVVAGYRKNFIKNTIDMVNVEYTYLGKENIHVLGAPKSCYYVKSVPLNGSAGVYDERWFDERGMIVKEKHVVGSNGTRIAELMAH